MLNSRQRRTLEAVFQRPVRADIRWDEVVSLLEACGANVSESSSGSRVRVELVGIRRTYHKPHRRETNKGTVDDVRDLLSEAGIQPGE